MTVFLNAAHSSGTKPGRVGVMIGGDTVTCSATGVAIEASLTVAGREGIGAIIGMLVFVKGKGIFVFVTVEG